MAEVPLNAGTVAANTVQGYDLVTLAAGIDVRRLSITNSSADSFILRANGQEFPIPRGAPADLEFASRVREFIITSGTAGFATRAVNIIAKGEPLAYPLRGY